MKFQISLSACFSSKEASATFHNSLKTWAWPLFLSLIYGVHSELNIEIVFIIHWLFIISVLLGAICPEFDVDQNCSAGKLSIIQGFLVQQSGVKKAFESFFSQDAIRKYYLSYKYFWIKFWVRYINTSLWSFLRLQPSCCYIVVHHSICNFSCTIRKRKINLLHLCVLVSQLSTSFLCKFICSHSNSWSLYYTVILIIMFIV